MRWLKFAVVVSTLVGCASAQVEVEGPVRLSEMSAQQLFARGIERAREGDYIGAEHYVQVARERGYSERKAVFELVKICLAGQRVQRGLSYALPYLEGHPNDWPLRQLIAAIYVAMDQPREAREQLEETLSWAPEVPEPHYLMGVVYRDGYGDVSAARESFERYLALAPRGSHSVEVRAWLRRARPTVVRDDHHTVEVIR